jgi:hypothetical protein
MMAAVVVSTMMFLSSSISAFQLSPSLIGTYSLSSSSSCRRMQHQHHRHTGRANILLLRMADNDDLDEDTTATTTNNNNKQRRRKRKKLTYDNEDSSSPSSLTTTTTKKESVKNMVQDILAREQLMLDDTDLTTYTPIKLEEDDRIIMAARKAGYSITGSSSSSTSSSSGGSDVTPAAGGGDGTQLEDLFDSRDFLQRKRERQIEGSSSSSSSSSNTSTNTGVVAPQTRKKIKRSDVTAFNKLLEIDPIADEDNSYFEDEGIDIISALLGDVEPGVGTDSDESSNMSGKRIQKRTSFLGIGSGPLQVGHFIGSLAIVLMSFVQYPGFPLTNLPDELRSSLQGGLGVIYLINTVLAVVAAGSAPSRNQSAILWAAKTFAVGGIAYDQLMQIPTPEELTERLRLEDIKLKRTSGRRGRK